MMRCGRCETCHQSLNVALTEGSETFAEYCGEWIDALGINQADLRERAEQVRHMRDIYSEAFYTAVWLGRVGEEA
jgi:hypothetical protein